MAMINGLFSDNSEEHGSSGEHSNPQRPTDDDVVYSEPHVNTARKANQLVEAILLLMATACLGWYGYNWIASEASQLWSSYSLDAELTGDRPTVRGFVRHVIHGHDAQVAVQSAPAAAPQDKAVQQPQTSESLWPANLPDGEDIGRIEIPRLNISSIIRQGVEDGTLSRAVGHVPYTPLPGQNGNVGLAAHRDTYFRNLRGVREGDLIRLVTPKGVFEYTVDSLKIVYPTNVEVLDPTVDPSLTLVTCFPFDFVGHAPKRFIVRARQKTTALPATRKS